MKMDIKKNAVPFILGVATGIIGFTIIKGATKKSVAKTTVTEKVEEKSNVSGINQTTIPKSVIDKLILFPANPKHGDWWEGWRYNGKEKVWYHHF